MLGVLLLPYLGVFVHLVVRWGKMHERERVGGGPGPGLREHIRQLAENPEGRNTSEE